MGKRKNWCKHYRGTYEHETCRVGVRYADVEKGRGVGPISLPCLGADGNALGATCDRCEFRTPEEIEAEEREHRERFEKIGKARSAIVAHLGGKWKRGTPVASGRIDCPACGTANALAFSRSGYNGHIHARCATPDCVTWME